jgi:hypothetical protein
MTRVRIPKTVKVKAVIRLLRRTMLVSVVVAVVAPPGAKQMCNRARQAYLEFLKTKLTSLTNLRSILDVRL